MQNPNFDSHGSARVIAPNGARLSADTTAYLKLYIVHTLAKTIMVSPLPESVSIAAIPQRLLWYPMPSVILNIYADPWLRHQMEIFSASLAFCAGSPVNSQHKDQWRWALMFSLICAWINGWVNNGEAGDLRRHRAHYDVTVMHWQFTLLESRRECAKYRSNSIVNSLWPSEATWRRRFLSSLAQVMVCCLTASSYITRTNVD